jgi:hypothetical protein
MGGLAREMAKLVAHLHATAALWVRIQTSLKNTEYKIQKSGQHTLARQKIYKKVDAAT